MEPRVFILVRQLPFSKTYVVDYGSVIGTTLTRGYGACAGEGELLAAITLKKDVCLTPTVDSTERDFEGAVVRFDALDDPGHSLVSSCRLTPQTICLSFCSFNSRCSASISTNCSQAAWARSLLRPLARSSCHWDAIVPPCGPSRSSLSCPPASVLRTLSSASS